MADDAQIINDEHWALVKEGKEALGYDREAYEHSL
jgi:hypothetical protein